VSGLTLYTKFSQADLGLVLESHQEAFDVYLEDSFSDEELTFFERQLDVLGAVYAQGISEEVSFEDFYPDPSKVQEQKEFFEACRSSLVFENLPYLEGNPFQVTYLLQLLEKIPECLIDRGGVHELQFHDEYVSEISKHRTAESLVKFAPPVQMTVKTKAPISPIDFLVRDVYREINRLRLENKLRGIEAPSEKTVKLFSAFLSDEKSSDDLFRLSGLGAKDFDDNLERLKFYLRKF
jgi:hypothetical protein